MQYQELTSTIQEVIVESDPHFNINELNSQDYASLRSQVLYVIDKYRQTRQNEQKSRTVRNGEDEEGSDMDETIIGQEPNGEQDNSKVKTLLRLLIRIFDTII